MKQNRKLTNKETDKKTDDLLILVNVAVLSVVSIYL